MPIQRFNIRVYGILENPRGEILVSDEITRGIRHTKFPGGGLELGEGLREGLKREFMEECGVSVDIGAHIYTTDVFVASAFDDDSQIISIYYYVHCEEWEKIAVSACAFDYSSGRGECFRWIRPEQLQSEPYFILPLDKAAFELIWKN